GAAEDLLREVESSLKNRLRQYSTSEISYVLAAETLRMTFSDSLLFQRASLQLNRRGLQSIGALSLVLKKYPQLEVIVVGHTDNRPVRRTNIRDNWDLSALRASTIVRILHRDFKLSAQRLTIQAHGQFDQLTTGDDASARAQNRRTEIVLLCPPPTEAKTPKP
ncbi:MAG: OmpA family protein, partial [Bacteroidota bacterium]